MTKEIAVDINPYQTRVVLLEDGNPVEVYIERRGHERIVGNIYNGRVQNVLPGMQAAFVDIGLGKNAFLYVGDIQADQSDFVFGDNGSSEINLGKVNIQDVVKQGQNIMVQILKGPIGTKGARVTTHITLPGRTLVLMPTFNYVGVSRRIQDEEERNRLKSVLEKIKPEGMGVIVRTAAAGKTEAEFEADLSFLVKLWQRIRQKSKLIGAPRLLHAEEPLIFRTIRDLFTPDISRLIINDKEFYERILVVADIISPTLKQRVELYQEKISLYEKFDLETKIDKTLQRKVWLKNGGYIVIDQTEALTSIDVNTGKFVGSDNLQETITQANCEAAVEIARQLRLRDLSGIIIIDFIDMEEVADKERVLETLREELKKDRTKSNVLGITSLGLVEMTRKKLRQSISNTLQIECPYCHGDGKVLSQESMVLKVRKQLIHRFNEETHANYLITVHPEVADLIDDNSTAHAPLLPRQPGRTVFVRALASMHMEDFKIEPINGIDDISGLNGGTIKAYS